MQQKNDALLQKADIQKQAGNWLGSEQTLSRIAPYTLSQGQKDSITFQRLLLLYLADSNEKAKVLIDNMDYSLIENPSTNLRVMQILILNELHLYSQAKELAAPLNDSLYLNVPKLKSEKKAKYLSILPGLGHIYTGDIVEGLACFTLNASVLAFGIYNIITGDYLTAYLGGAGLLASTYLGTGRRAEHLAKKYNFQHCQDFNLQIKEILINFLEE